PSPDGITQQMEVMAKQWEWQVRYPSSATMKGWEDNPELAKAYDQKPDISDVHVPNEIHVWKDAQVLVHLKTSDVIHSFFLPNLRLKQDALPGKSIPVWFAVTEYNTERQKDPNTGEWRWVEKDFDFKENKPADPTL